ncbi:MAG TPA: ATP-dependent helicase, partial [Acidimicrobiia bacterium]|nr:ATP-dependent helicase [Acidimicrobiia bacterium]
MDVREIRVEPEDWPEALADTDGYQIVVAGPGTGKTEFLVRRVAHLVNSGRARRDEIVVMCFSRRAAADLRRRIDQAIGAQGVPVDTTTFHSLALRLLETAADGERPVPLTTPEQVGVVAEILAEEDPKSWPVTYRGILTTPAFATEVADFLMRCSERLLTPDDLEDRAAERADWRGLPGLYRRYLEHLRNTGRTDYGVLLTQAVALLETEEGRRLVSRYSHVLVDEYQDTSPAQARVADMLAAPSANLTVAGDPYQSIYSFRGAELRNVADFSRKHPDAKRVILSRSFRVPEEIFEAALRVVSSGELPGAAGPVEPAPHRGRVEAFVFDQEAAEADWIAREVEHAIEIDRVPPAAIAVLVRSKKELLGELSRALDRRKIPHDPPDARLVDHPAVRLLHDLATVALVGGPPGEVHPGS